eukprot:SAG22_NODE_744_length_7501_cov_2.644826_4_plen_266_part_00
MPTLALFFCKKSHGSMANHGIEYSLPRPVNSRRSGSSVFNDNDWPWVRASRRGLPRQPLARHTRHTRAPHSNRQNTLAEQKVFVFGVREHIIMVPVLVGLVWCVAAAGRPASPLPPSQRCGVAEIAGNWTRTDMIAFPHTRVEIVPLGGTEFAVLAPQISSRRSSPTDPRNGLGSVLPNGTMEVNCSKPRWCRTLVGGGFPPKRPPAKVVSIDTKYMIFGAWKGRANCSQITMVNPPGAPGAASKAVYCNRATDSSCPAPPDDSL